MCKWESLQEVQLPQEHLSFLQKFFITKYLKQEVDDDLSVYLDEKVMNLLPPMEKSPINFYHGVVFTA